MGDHCPTGLDRLRSGTLIHALPLPFFGQSVAEKVNRPQATCQISFLSNYLSMIEIDIIFTASTSTHSQLGSVS